MAAAALARRTRGASRRLDRRALRQSLRRLWRWAKAGPDFAHMVQHLEAESACIHKDERRAQSGGCPAKASALEADRRILLGHGLPS